jgi:hypothetical protein
VQKRNLNLAVGVRRSAVACAEVGVTAKDIIDHAGDYSALVMVVPGRHKPARCLTNLSATRHFINLDGVQTVDETTSFVVLSRVGTC